MSTASFYRRFPKIHPDIFVVCKLWDDRLPSRPLLVTGYLTFCFSKFLCIQLEDWMVKWFLITLMNLDNLCRIVSEYVHLLVEFFTCPFLYISNKHDITLLNNELWRWK